MIWTAYIKFQNPNLKIENFISKVRFGLHKDYNLPFKDIIKSDGNKFTISKEGYTMFSMPISIYFKKETGLTVESFKLPKFEYEGVVKRPFVKINKMKYSALL